MTIATFTKTGSKATTPAKLDAKVFGIKEISKPLLKQAYVAYHSSGRQNSAFTMTRGMIRGGGRKPWKQKGTGRARHGSIRSPIWRGGGITFGPTGEENYTKKLSTVSKRTAITHALTLAAGSEKISVIDTFAVADAKTKTAKELLNKLGFARKTLIVVENISPELARSTKNIKGVKPVQATYLNVFDVMNSDNIVIEKSALPIISTWLVRGSK